VKTWGLWVIGCVALAAACADEDDDDAVVQSCSRACETVAPCEGVTQAECEERLCPIILSGPCLRAIEAATCEDTVQETPSYNDVCFPPCTDGSQTCSGDIIALCTPFPIEPRQLTLSCSDVCALNDAAYSGTCGTSYQGQPSSNGGDVCFCSQ
jgi:hypothetical protein